MKFFLCRMVVGIFFFCVSQSVLASGTNLLSADSMQVEGGGSTILRATIPTGSSCIIRGGVYSAPNVSPNGQSVGSGPTWVGTTGILGQDTTFSLDCQGYNLSSLTIKTINKVPVIEPSLLSADSMQVEGGGSTILRATIPTGSSCIIRGGVYSAPNVSPNGQSVGSGPTWVGTTGILGQDTTFSLDCQGYNLSSLTIKTINKVPVIEPSLLSADSMQVEGGGSTILRATIPTGSSCIIRGGVYSAPNVSPNGQSVGSGPTWVGTTGILGQDTTFSLDCGSYGRKDIMILVKPKISTFTGSELVISTTHRYDNTAPGLMYGGWGQHLGKILQSNSGEMWFVNDSGNDVYNTPEIKYHKLSNGKWKLVGSNKHYGNIQQNIGSISLNNGFIYSYGIDTKNHRVEECYFSTIEPYNLKACNTISDIVLEDQSNYIGAALTPQGYRMVWWTNVSYTGKGSFSYIYNDGTNWKGPFTSKELPYNAISYGSIVFTGDTNFMMLAERVFTNGTTGVIVGTGTLGNPLNNWENIENDNTDPVIVPQDVIIDSQKNIHFLLRTKNSKLLLISKTSSGIWKNFTTIHNFAYTGRLIKKSNAHISIVYAPLLDGGIFQYNFGTNFLSNEVNMLPQDIHKISSDNRKYQAIYKQDSSYQSAPIEKIDIASNPLEIPGNGIIEEAFILHQKSMK